MKRLVIGNCRLMDPKMEKNGAFEITMGKDDKASLFSCDNQKGTVSSQKEEIVTFKFNPPKMDPFIAEIEAFQHFGQWVESRAELKVSGGLVKAGRQDTLVFEVVLRAYVNQI